MKRDALPGPLTRLRRNRYLLGAVVVVAALATSTASVRESAGIELQTSVDANWRGAYDLLVRPPGRRLDLERTGGLVEPNFLAFAGAGGISIADLEAIRAVPDVEIAAPVANLGNMRYAVGGPVLVRAALPEQPTLYRVTLRVESFDGLRNVLVQEQTDDLLLGPGRVTDPVTSRTAGGSGGDSQVGIDVDYAALPAISTPVIAVDPAAERALLGPTAGFLDAFQALGRLPDTPTVAEFDPRLIPPEFEDQRFFIMALASGPGGPRTRERPVIPVAVSKTLYASLTVTADIVQVGQPLAAYPDAVDVATRLADAARMAGAGETALGRTTIDASRALRPLQAPRLMLVWPDTPPPEFSAASVGVAPELNAELAGRPMYEPAPARPGTDRLSFRVGPVGLVDASGAARDPGDTTEGPATVGLEAAYRDTTVMDMPLVDDFVTTGGLDRPFVFAPLASFDLRELDLRDDPLTYVPLGAYAPPQSRYVAAPDGTPVSAPVALSPTLNPKGFINMPPLAITNIQSAALLRAGDPIDAVRVRVAGLDRYDRSAVRTVERVASEISRLGLDVDVVAGSSPQPVELYVAGYDVSSQPPSDLGWVEQGWTTMGAAERVTAGLGGTNVALLALSVLTALAFGVGLPLLQIGVRAQEVAILIAVGWPRRRIARWIVGEAFVAGLIVLSIGLAAWIVMGGLSSDGLIMAMVLGVTIPMASTVTVPVLLRGTTPGRISSGDVRLSVARMTPTVRGAWTYGVRTALARPIRLAAIALALGIAAGSVAVGGLVLASTAATVGPTRLAAALSAVLAPYQAAILGLAALGATLLGALLLGLDRSERRSEISVLRACGWASDRVRRTVAVHRAVIALPAMAVSAVVSIALGDPLGAASPAVVMGSAASLVAFALLLEVRWASR